MAADTILTIDGVFVINELFNWLDLAPIEGAAENTAYTGSLRTYVQFYKDHFTVDLPKLTLAQMSQLKQLMQVLGGNPYHTVQYVTPGITRIWDGVTQPGYGINTDVNRVRNKVRVRPYASPHFPNYSQFYSAMKIDCQET